jgi:hypothetical protein
VDAAALAQMITSKYANCRSHWSQGVASSRTLNGEKFAISFETWFARPASFRFDWVRPHPFEPLGQVIRCPSSIYSNSAQTLWRSFRQDQKIDRLMPDLETAVARATGVSLGASLLMYQLFLPSMPLSKSSPLLLVRSCRMGPTFKGYILYRERGDSPETLELWLDDVGFLRKVLRTDSDRQTEIDIISTAFDTPATPECFLP